MTSIPASIEQAAGEAGSDALGALLRVSLNDDGSLQQAATQKALGGSIASIAYRLASDGTTVTAYDKTGTVVSSGTDFGAVLAAVLPAASAAGFAIELRNDGNVFPNRSLVSLPKALTSKLYIRGNGCVVQAAVSAGRRLFDFNRVADYDLFQNIEVWDLTFDRNNFTAASNETAFMGNGVGGAFSQRISFGNIALRRCKTINMPVGGTGATFSLGLAGAHLASNETQTTITSIVQEDCDWGGDYGYAIFGAVAAGGTHTSGLGVNVFIDEIHVIRGSYDRGVTPAAFYASGCQIGGYGFGRKVRITDWTSKNSGDVGIEIDGIQDLVGNGCHVVDAWNTKYLVGNFRPPIDVRSQKNTWRDCHCENIALDRVNRHSRDFEIFGSPNVADSTTFGELVAENFSSLDEISTAPFVGVPHFIADSVDFRKVTLHGRIGYSALAVTSGGNAFTGVQFRNTVNQSSADIDLTYTFAGTRTGAGTNQWKMCDANGTDLRLRARIAVDRADYTGLTLTTDTFNYIQPAGFGASTIKCEQLTPICLRTIGATQGKDGGVVFGGSFTAAGHAYIEGMDMVKAFGGSGFDVDVSNMPVAQIPNIVIRKVLSQRTAASGSGPITAPTAMTGLVTATGAAIGATSKGVPCLVQFVQGSGSAITAIDFSTNGGTTYTNLLTQASAAMPAGSDLVLGPLPPDALIKVTFTTTQPTINLVPVNP